MSTSDPYDPQAAEGESPKGSAYVSKKDIKVVAIGLVMLALLLWPVVKVLVRRSEKARCINNMNSMMEAINQYAIQNDDKFPPLFDTGSNDEPMLQASHAPFTWASTLQDYMNKRASFKCPSALEEELSRSQDSHHDTETFALSYGMFAPMSNFNKSLVENPDEAVLIGETSNGGANHTFDPLGFKDAQGNKMPYDGMAIGWDNDNFDGDKTSNFVTRLAFPNTANGKFEKDGEGRHDEGTFVLTVTGHLRTIKPDMARVIRRYKTELIAPWEMPLTAKRHK